MKIPSVAPSQIPKYLDGPYHYENTKELYDLLGIIKVFDNEIEKKLPLKVSNIESVYYKILNIYKDVEETNLEFKGIIARDNEEILLYEETSFSHAIHVPIFILKDVYCFTPLFVIICNIIKRMINFTEMSLLIHDMSDYLFEEFEETKQWVEEGEDYKENFLLLSSAINEFEQSDKFIRKIYNVGNDDFRIFFNNYYPCTYIGKKLKLFCERLNKNLNKYPDLSNHYISNIEEAIVGLREAFRFCWTVNGPLNKWCDNTYQMQEYSTGFSFPKIFYKMKPHVFGSMSVSVDDTEAIKLLTYDLELLYSILTKRKQWKNEIKKQKKYSADTSTGKLPGECITRGKSFVAGLRYKRKRRNGKPSFFNKRTSKKIT